MRSSQRDHSGTITFALKFADAAAGNGVTPNGIAYTWSRTSTGIYGFNFDTRILPIAIATAANSQAAHAISAALDYGYVQAVVLLNNAVANWGGSFIVTAIDRRT